MIVAAYTNGTALWATVLPIAPVTRIDKYPRQQREQRRSHQETTSFAALLVSLQKAQDNTESNGFDHRA